MSNNAPLTIQKVRELIAEKHNILLDENDPILMLVTVHRAFLDEFEEVIKNHDQKLSEDMNVHVLAFTTEVRKATNTLLSKGVKTSVENCLSVVSQHQQEMTSFLVSIRNMGFLAVIMFVLSLIVSVSTIVWG
ncbi:hypothetical protein [Maridesulfovibrio frigidus]|uniref:hypothetical protein n=1 Tax=Maridesulfovibrio frigidus TaxID=340956 RepID=UPI0004E0CA9D|nr:hypothetical protein [Maridesulfovibrio frigidus]